MLEKDLLFIKKFLSEDLIEDYQSVIKFNDEAFADYIASAILYSVKKTKPLFPQDKFRVIINELIYNFYCLIDFEHKNLDLEKYFKDIRNFVDEFTKLIKNMRSILYNQKLTPEMVADIYVLYFAAVKIYEKIFDTFDEELKKDFLRSRGIQLSGLYDKTLDEHLEYFDQVSSIIRKLKKEDN